MSQIVRTTEKRDTTQPRTQHPRIAGDASRDRSVANLTPAQLRFAERQHATLGPMGVPEGVFMYREDPDVAYRWLVAPDGRVLDLEVFKRGR